LVTRLPMQPAHSSGSRRWRGPPYRTREGRFAGPGSADRLRRRGHSARAVARRVHEPRKSPASHRADTTADAGESAPSPGRAPERDREHEQQARARDRAPRPRQPAPAGRHRRSSRQEQRLAIAAGTAGGARSSRVGPKSWQYEIGHQLATQPGQKCATSRQTTNTATGIRTVLRTPYPQCL
jgi:hypothetical protein